LLYYCIQEDNFRIGSKINIKQPLMLSHFSWMMGSCPRNEDNTGHELEKQEFLSEECGEAST